MIVDTIVKKNVKYFIHAIFRTLWKDFCKKVIEYTF